VKFNFDVSARAFLAVPSGAAGADITAVRLIGVNIKSGTTDTVMVNTYDDFGSAPYSYADSYFVVGVY
jgi:hypothetical protein